MALANEEPHNPIQQVEHSWDSDAFQATCERHAGADHHFPGAVHPCIQSRRTAIAKGQPEFPSPLKSESQWSPDYG